MNRFSADWFDGQTSRLHSVTVERVGTDRLGVFGVNLWREEKLADLRITPRLARTARTIEFPDGARLLVGDHPVLDELFPSEDRIQRLTERLERHAYAIAASIVICISAAFITFTWGVPWLADRIVASVPTDVESRIGKDVVNQLDTMFGFKVSGLSADRQQTLRARFNALASDLPSAPQYRLEFRDAESIGANALAVPGGTIIVTDQLVELFDDDREFDAVVAHELGHQEHRHAFRQTLRSSFVLVIAALFTGDVSSASAIVVGVPTMLLQSHYSRGFEEEADSFAFDALSRHKISPAWFGSAIAKLTQYKEDEDDSLAYLGSHPSNAARIAAAQTAGVAFLSKHPELARETPGYDACAEEGDCPEEDECEDEDCEYTDSDDEECFEEDYADPDSDEPPDGCID